MSHYITIFDCFIYFSSKCQIRRAQDFRELSLQDIACYLAKVFKNYNAFQPKEKSLANHFFFNIGYRKSKYVQETFNLKEIVKNIFQYCNDTDFCKL